MSYDLYRLYIYRYEKKKNQTKAGMAIFVKNTFSPVDFLFMFNM